MVDVVDETATDHAYFDLLHWAISSRVLTGCWHI
jgi:hypothetical protein